MCGGFADFSEAEEFIESLRLARIEGAREEALNRSEGAGEAIEVMGWNEVVGMAELGILVGFGLAVAIGGYIVGRMLLGRLRRLAGKEVRKWGG